MLSGIKEKTYMNNPFTRFHQSIEEYPHFHDDLDDISFNEHDNWERLKKFDPKEGSTIGDTTAIPAEDNDQKLVWSDVQGETVYTNPPDSNVPFIDHGLDEDHIWAFNLTSVNQIVIKNQYSRSVISASRLLHQPFWGEKLITPVFYTEEKYERFLRQWDLRLGLEQIKMKHAIYDLDVNNKKYRNKMREEVEAYLAEAYRQDQAENLKDVYVTTHTPKIPRYHTNSEKEDQEFYNYYKSLQDYNEVVPEKYVPTVRPGMFNYKRGSAMQRTFDPLAGAKRLENGTMLYEIKDDEFGYEIFDEKKLRDAYEKQKGQDEQWDMGTEDEDEIRTAILLDLERNNLFSTDEFAAVLDKEFSVFKEGEKYDFVKDLKLGYANSLSKSSAQAILETIPDYVFWDIKKPKIKEEERVMNPYNPFRRYPNESFFDIRENEEYNDRRNKKENLKDAVSTYRKY